MDNFSFSLSLSNQIDIILEFPRDFIFRSLAISEMTVLIDSKKNFRLELSTEIRGLSEHCLYSFQFEKSSSLCFWYLTANSPFPVYPSRESGTPYDFVFISCPLLFFMVFDPNPVVLC